MIDPSLQRTIPDRLTAADDAAGEGHWTQAVTQWAASRNGPRRADAEHRIRWFLDQDAPPGKSERDLRRETNSAVLLTGFGLAILGTAIVLFGLGRHGTVQDVVSVAAWLCYVVAAALAVAWAWRAGRLPSRSAPITDDDVSRALHLAIGLDRDARSTPTSPSA